MAIVVALLECAANGDESDTWRFSADTLFYTDSDNVVVISPQVGARVALDEEGGNVNARALIDVVSAASVDVVSHATKRFSEVRSEADLAVAKAFGDYLPSLSYRISHEPDYDSNAFGGGVQRRLGTPDTVLALGYDVSFDRVGYTGTPDRAFSGSLVSHDASVTLTQVLGERTLVRGVYTLSVQDGYMEKPYRFVPLFDQAGIDAARNDGVELDLETFDRYRLALRPAEEVPDLRVGHAFAVRGLRYVDRMSGSLRLDAQFFVDSWGITAETLEPGLVWNASEAIMLSVYDRLYFQQEARFWRREYVVAGPSSVPRWRTMDRDLSTYFASTLGGRLELRRGWLSAYADLSGNITAYQDYIFLDGRVAFIAQGGVRLHL